VQENFPTHFSLFSGQTFGKGTSCALSINRSAFRRITNGGIRSLRVRLTPATALRSSVVLWNRPQHDGFTAGCKSAPVGCKVKPAAVTPLCPAGAGRGRLGVRRSQAHGSRVSRHEPSCSVTVYQTVTFQFPSLAVQIHCFGARHAVLGFLPISFFDTVVPWCSYSFSHFRG
jgi:hypothetical protein